jgi:hypothetical protein
LGSSQSCSGVPPCRRPYLLLPSSHPICFCQASTHPVCRRPSRGRRLLRCVELCMDFGYIVVMAQMALSKLIFLYETQDFNSIDGLNLLSLLVAITTLSCCFCHDKTFLFHCVGWQTTFHCSIDSCLCSCSQGQLRLYHTFINDVLIL